MVTCRPGWRRSSLRRARHACTHGVASVLTLHFTVRNAHSRNRDATNPKAATKHSAPSSRETRAARRSTGRQMRSRAASGRRCGSRCRRRPPNATCLLEATPSCAELCPAMFARGRRRCASSPRTWLQFPPPRRAARRDSRSAVKALRMSSASPNVCSQLIALLSAPKRWRGRRGLASHDRARQGINRRGQHDTRSGNGPAHAKRVRLLPRRDVTHTGGGANNRET